MDLAKLAPRLISQLASAVEAYIVASREKYVGSSVPLAAAQKSAMHPFFTPEILDSVRVLVLNDSRIEDPPFYSMAKMMGIRNLPSFSDVEAVTFVDVVVSHREFSDDLLFHELVHAVQYASLGSREFASRYVNGFIKGASYDAIPLERQARELEERFTTATNQAFSVAQEVEGWIAMGKL